MKHSALRREFSELIDLDAPVERLAGGFTFTEGPIWHPTDERCQCLLACGPDDFPGARARVAPTLEARRRSRNEFARLDAPQRDVDEPSGARAGLAFAR